MYLCVSSVSLVMHVWKQNYSCTRVVGLRQLHCFMFNLFPDVFLFHGRLTVVII
jgi:hypothetical protein